MLFMLFKLFVHFMLIKGLSKQIAVIYFPLCQGRSRACVCSCALVLQYSRDFTF